MRAFITLAVCWGLTPLVQAASFDCRQAATLVETTICQDAELSALDDALAEQYQALWDAHIRYGARQALKATQRAWLKSRNRCQDHACLVTAYRERLDHLCQDYPVLSDAHPGCVDLPNTAQHITEPPSRAFSRCRLQVDGRDYIDCSCRGSLECNGSFQINGSAFFAIVQVEEPGLAQGFWIEKPHATHAHSPLGTLHRDGACWINPYAMVSAWE